MSTSWEWTGAISGSIRETAGPSEHPDAVGRRHLSAAVATFAAAAAIAPFANALPVEQQLAFLAASIGLLGLPHGAFDFLQARGALAARFGAWWPAVFAGGYAALIALALASWSAVPRLSLTVFFIASAVHFGREDSLEVRTSGSWRRIDLAARGSIPILVPLAVHAETIRFLEWLVPAGTMLPAEWMRLGAGVLLIGAAAVILRSTFLGTSGAELVRAASTAALFTVLTPLIAFSVYFCVWHAPRHVLQVARELSLDLRAIKRATTLAVAPLTLLVVVAALTAWAYLRTSGVDFAPATARVVFIGLAAVTAPHMAFGAWLEARS